MAKDDTAHALLPVEEVQMVTIRHCEKVHGGLEKMLRWAAAILIGYSVTFGTWVVMNVTGTQREVGQETQRLNMTIETSKEIREVAKAARDKQEEIGKAIARLEALMQAKWFSDEAARAEQGKR